MAYEYGTGLGKADRIAKNVRDLIELERGTVPYDRERGVDTAWREKPRGRYTAAMLSEITDMVNSRETRAETSVTTTDGETMRVRIRLSEDEE